MTVQSLLCCAFMQGSHNEKLQDLGIVKPNRKVKKKVGTSWWVHNDPNYRILSTVYCYNKTI